MGTLKDALLKAGIKETPKPSAPNQREKLAKKQVTEVVVHQEQRNWCEACDQIKPDVELYKHRNPTTDAEWICVRCADQLQISDTFRKTAQSDTAIKKLFRREYGPTMQIDSKAKSDSRSKGPVNGNR